MMSERVVEYHGYEPAPGIVSPIDVVATVTPEEFFERYVARRRPVILRGYTADAEWRGANWTNKYLKGKAGDTNVIVEQRGVDKGAAFGLTAPKVQMTYGEFLDKIDAGSDRFYLTTQDLERFEDDLDDHDMPQSVLAEPLQSLQDDFPVQPKLVGNLIPYQLSLWQGLAKNGASSGLHHDYHDNLYMLLRGRKRFRLFPPSAGLHMKTAGTIAKVYPNGLIVYRNKPDDPTVVVRADGVPISFLARQKKDDAELDLARAEDALRGLGSRDLDEASLAAERSRLEEVIEQCEGRIEEAMDELLVYGCPGEIPSDSDSDDEQPQVKKPRHDSAAAVKMPDHFCDMTFPTKPAREEELFELHPRLKQVGCLSCDLLVGDMLYLPASWFHEVTSFSDKPTENVVTKCADDVGHLALNYWFYPPDNDVFARPYKHEFWPRRWEVIQQGSPLPIQHVWSSDDEEHEGEGEEEEEEGEGEERTSPVT